MLRVHVATQGETRLRPQEDTRRRRRRVPSLGAFVPCRPVQLFHYHLVTSRVREVEARYIGKLGFDLVARYGRIGEELTSYEPGVSWEELDAMGFKLRLTELERGAVNVVVQPGQWPVPRVDHLGFALDEDEFQPCSGARRADADLRVQEHGGRRTFVSTNAGYRLEIHPPRDWIEDLLGQGDELSLSELHLKPDDPRAKAEALAQICSTASRDGAERRGRRRRSSASPAAARRAGRSWTASCSASRRRRLDFVT